MCPILQTACADRGLRKSGWEQDFGRDGTEGGFGHEDEQEGGWGVSCDESGGPGAEAKRGGLQGEEEG